MDTDKDARNRVARRRNHAVTGVAANLINELISFRVPFAWFAGKFFGFRYSNNQALGCHVWGKVAPCPVAGRRGGHSPLWL